jgi:hypothetical protein
MDTRSVAGPAPEELLAGYPDFDPAFVAVYAMGAPFTMTSPERMYALWQASRHVLARGVPGALVECGVWRGGSAMIMAHVLAEHGSDRELWLYDTFAGMPEPSAVDVDVHGTSARTQLARGDEFVVANASLTEVQANMARTAHPAERIVYVEGQVEDTIPRRAPDSIALLRLDTDWEASTRHELEHLWPRLALGGVLIVDDYGHWAGAHRAVDEFFAGRADAPLLTRVDYTGRIAVRAH